MYRDAGVIYATVAPETSSFRNFFCGFHLRREASRRPDSEISHMW
jgi:hypothetical protein